MDFKYKNIFKYQGKTLGGTSYYNEKNDKATKRKRRRPNDTSRKEKSNKQKHDVSENNTDTENVVVTADNETEQKEVIEHTTHMNEPVENTADQNIISENVTEESKEPKDTEVDVEKEDRNNRNDTKIDMSAKFADASVSTVSYSEIKILSHLIKLKFLLCCYSSVYSQIIYLTF